jgi:hypothetical protein
VERATPLPSLAKPGTSNALVRRLYYPQSTFLGKLAALAQAFHETLESFSCDFLVADLTAEVLKVVVIARLRDPNCDLTASIKTRENLSGGPSSANDIASSARQAFHVPPFMRNLGMISEELSNESLELFIDAARCHRPPD